MNVNMGFIEKLVKDVSSTWLIIAAHGLLSLSLHVCTDYITGVPRGEKALGYVSTCFVIYLTLSPGSVMSPYKAVDVLFLLCLLQVNIFNGRNMASAVNFTGMQVRTNRLPAV